MQVMGDVAANSKKTTAACFLSLLKDCGKTKDVGRGSKLHAEVLQKGLLEKSSYLASSIISMYCKCGDLAMAKQVLEEIPVRDVFSWNAMISGYARGGKHHEAMDFFEQMQNEGLSPDAITLSSVLKACGGAGDVGKGKQVHDMILRRGFLQQEDMVLGNALIDMYARCGDILQAHRMLRGLPARDVVSWNTLIAALCRHGRGLEALDCYETMRSKEEEEGISPDAVTFVCALKAFSSCCAGALESSVGEQIHGEVEKKGYLLQKSDVGNALVDMYAKCGKLQMAREVLRQLPFPDTVSWNALMCGYLKHGRGREALHCLAMMQSEGFSADSVTFICALEACGISGSADAGKCIHHTIASTGLLGGDVVLDTALVDMYAKCGMVETAEAVLDAIPLRNSIAWNVVVSGYARQKRVEEAMACLERMSNEGLPPDSISVACIFKACGIAGSIGRGELLHRKIAGILLSDDDATMANAVVDMYARCGFLDKAEQVLRELSRRDGVCWSALIAGYARVGRGGEALESLEQMQREAMVADAITLISVLKACGAVGALHKGKQIHANMVSRNFPYQSCSRRWEVSEQKGDALKNALVGMYSTCGAFAEARQVLEEEEEDDDDYDYDNDDNDRQVVRASAVRDGGIMCWNALIAGYVRQRRWYEAMECLEQIRQKRKKPDAATFVCILQACGGAIAAEKGEKIYREVVNRGMMMQEKNTAAQKLGNAMVDMYAKCGLLHEAERFMEELLCRDVVAWSALIAGYARYGHGDRALRCFRQMIEGEGVEPDGVTILCVLTACSRAGMVQEASMMVEDMETRYGIRPKEYHHGCMLSALGCAGGGKMVMMASPPPSAAVWLALLCACRKWGNVELGRKAFEQVIRAEEACALAYVYMAEMVS